MEELDFVTFEQALKLFELGFNRDVIRYYAVTEIKSISEIDNEVEIVAQRGDLLYGPVYIENTQKSDPEYTIKAPMISQVQKWLSEEKGIIIWIEPEFMTDNDSEETKLVYIAHYCDMRGFEQGIKPTYGRTISVFESELDDNITDAMLNAIDMALSLL